MWIEITLEFACGIWRIFDNKRGLETVYNAEYPIWEIGTHAILPIVTPSVPGKGTLFPRLLLSLVKWWVTPKSKIKPLSMLVKFDATYDGGEGLTFMA